MIYVLQTVYEMGLILAMDDTRLEELEAEAAEELERIHNYARQDNKIPASSKAKQRFQSVMDNLTTIFPAKKKKRNKDDLFLVCPVRHFLK